MAGEITTRAVVDFQQVARETIKRIGYDNTEYGIDYKGCAVLVAYDKQSSDIAQGVDEGKGLDLEQGAGRPGSHVRLRLRRDGAVHAAAHLPCASPGRASVGTAARRPLAVAAPRCEISGHDPLRGRQARRDRHRRAVDAARAGQAAQGDRGGGDRADRQAGAAEAPGQGQYPLSHQPHRPLRGRRTAGRLRSDRAQDHRRHLWRRGPSRRRRLLRQGPVQGRSLCGLRGALRRQEHRRRGARAANARSRSPTPSASPNPPA